MLEILVKPTISEKNKDTSSYVSGTTCSPRFNCSATSLQQNQNNLIK